MRFGQRATTARVTSGASPPASGPLNIVLHGNSLFSFVAERVDTLRPGSDVVTGRVVGGATTADLQAEFDTQIHTLWDTGRTNVVVLWEALDHINDFDGTASSAYAAYASYRAHAAGTRGWRVYVCTVIDTLEYTAASPHPTRGNLEPERDGFNTLLRADYAGAYGIVDLAARSEFSNAANTTYFNGDGIHITSAGQDVAAEEIDSVLG